MKLRPFLLFAFSSLLLSACNKSEDLPTPEAVMVKFENKTGKDIHDLTVSGVVVNSLKKGASTSDYLYYESLGQQFGYALVETVGMIGGEHYYTASACRGVCGTPSAPFGQWLSPGYYRIAIFISEEPGGNYLSFRMMN